MKAQVGVPAAAVRAHEELFAYWASLKDGARLPGRRHLDPGGMKRLLPTVSLIEVARNDPMDFRVRLAGTGLYGVYGGEITGKSLADIYNTAAADYWRGGGPQRVSPPPAPGGGRQPPPRGAPPTCATSVRARPPGPTTA